MSNKEIERKYLVVSDFKKHVIKEIKIVQGFLSTVPERTVRVRIKDDKGFLTIKGIGNKSGVSRYEFEKEISIIDANNLLNICETGQIDKTRYIIPTSHNLFFEVDEFHDDNDGLIIAEIELPSEDTVFKKPDWLGKEVTGIAKYYNASISNNPYKKWDKD
jgi:adenylate cyclase